MTDTDIVGALRRGADCREDDDISGRGWSGATDARLLREHADQIEKSHVLRAVIASGRRGESDG